MFLAIAKSTSDATDDAYLANELPLPAHEGDAVLHRQVQSSLYGLLQREIKVEPTERERTEGGVNERPRSSSSVASVSAVCLTSR